MFDEKLPIDLHAEEQILGRLMNRHGKKVLISKLSPQHFYSTSHRLIFRAIADLQLNGHETGSSNVRTWLSDRGQLEAAAGYENILNISGSVVYDSGDALFTNPELCAEIVIDCWRRRQVLEAMAKIAELLGDRGLPFEEILPAIEKQFFDSLQSDATTLGSEVFSDAIANKVALVFDKTLQPEVIIPTGIKSLDHIVGGFRKSNLWIIAGESSSGKSALLLQMAFDAAMQGVPVLVFSLEMTIAECAGRWVSRGTGISHDKLQNRDVSPKEYSMLAEMLAVTGSEFTRTEIVDTEIVTMATIYRTISRFRAKHGDIGLVAIDHIQLLDCGDSKQRHLELDKQARNLKRLAKQFNCTIVALSQINRATSGSADKRPNLGSIRDSSAIATHADIVLGLYRDEVHNPQSVDKGIAEIMVLKNRHGFCSTAKVLFKGNLSSFENLNAIA